MNLSVNGTQLNGSNYKLKLNSLDVVFHTDATAVILDVKDISDLYVDQMHSTPLTTVPEVGKPYYFAVMLGAGTDMNPKVLWDDLMKTGSKATGTNATIEYINLFRSPGSGSAMVLFKYTENTPTQHQVTFNLDGGTMTGTNPVMVNNGEKVTKPSDPTPPANHRFVNWYKESTFNNVFDFNIETITADTTIYAKYAKEYNILITDGGPDKSVAINGEIVTITADPAPYGKEFDKWVVEEGTIALGNANNSTTTFTMPESNVRVKATYKDKAVTPTYTIEEGANQTYIIDSNIDIVIKASGEKAKLGMILVDGTKLDTTNYTTKDGSTILTLKASYLNTLSEGDHTVEFAYDDGSVSTNLKVVKNNTTNGSTDAGTNTSNPQTSDNIVYYIVTMLLSLFGISGASVYVNRKKLFNR